MISAISSSGTKVKNGIWIIDCSSRSAMTKSLFSLWSDRVSILRYPLHCLTTHFRCLDFSTDSNDSINADFAKKLKRRSHLDPLLWVLEKGVFSTTLAKNLEQVAAVLRAQSSNSTCLKRIGWWGSRCWWRNWIVWWDSSWDRWRGCIGFSISNLQITITSMKYVFFWTILIHISAG